MSKIKLNDSGLEIITKMSDGNPGAMSALAELIKNNERIDPDSVLGPLGAILYLDSVKIYGSDIYILFNDKCNRDVRKLIMLLRAAQMGKFYIMKLKELSLDQSYKINISEDDWSKIESDILEALPNFVKV